MVSPFLKQAWTVSGVLLNMVAQGMLLSYPSSLLPALRDPDSTIKVDLNTASWIASSVGIAGIPGFLLSAFLMVPWGRKRVHALVIFPGILGWTLVYFATNVPTIMAGRIFGGVTAGATVALGAVVIGEYTSPEHRGMFLNLKTASVCLGSMLVHILGNYCSWRAIALIALIPHFVAVSIILTWPESPAWLASKKHFDRCESSFYWLRGKNDHSTKELDELIRSQMDQKSQLESSLWEKVIGFLKKFTRKDFLMPVSIMMLGALLIEVCGRHLFPAYALDIIGEVTGNKTQSFYYTLGLDLVITISATFSSVLVRLMKRRTLLFTTGSAALVVLAAVCTYLLLISKQIISNDHPWIPLSMFIVYFILVNLGCTPIPLAFLGEVIPLEHRGAGSAVAGVILSLCVNAGLQITPFLLASIQVHGTFTVLGISMAVCLVILYFILPETKDRTLQEIEYYFNNGRFSDDEVKVDVKDLEATVKMLGKDEVVM